MKRFLLKRVGSINWRKTSPLIVLWLIYGTLFLILLSSIGMFLATVTGNFEMGKDQLTKAIPELGRLLVFYSPPASSHFSLLLITAVLAVCGWLFSTRVKVSTASVRRRMFFFAFVVITFTVVFNVFASNYLRPITYDKIMTIDTFVKGEDRQYVNPGALRFLGIAVMMIPEIVSFFFLSWLIGVYREDKVVQDWFADYKFQWKYLSRFGDEMANVFPDITLAIDAVLRVPVVLMGASRQLGTLLIGPPGSGKTSLKIIKGVRQDLAHMQKMINAFPVLAQKYGTDSPEFKKKMGKHLIGTVVIEPAKDLCDKSFHLAKEHGIPDRLIVYLDPSNPRTPGFNCMIGPIEQVAETITAVLDGMSEVSNEFFRQACRTVLKQYIYLLKFHMKNTCSLLDLDQMYQDPRFTKDMVEEVRKKLPSQTDINRMPNDMQIYWMLVTRTLRWFDNDGLEEERDRQTGMVLRYESGPYRGQVKIKDKQTEFTRQTRNLLADLIQNPYLARILVGSNAVDLDKLMGKGGILLCNTDNGLLGNVSDAFGKLVLMSTQNAVFRRKGDEDTRPLVSVYVDEFYDYMNSPFLKLAGQGRKYKVAFLVACQSLSQFKFKFDESFVDAMVGTIRNFIVYGGVGQYDAKKLMPIFGTQVEEVVSTRESVSPENTKSPNVSYAQTVTREEKELVSEDEIMFNKFKFSYIRLVVEGSTTKAIKAEGDFVDMGDANKWKKALNEDAVKAFMQYWQNDSEKEDAFDMNWIDTWGEAVGSDQNDDTADLEQQIQIKQTAPVFEEIAKTDSSVRRFQALSPRNEDTEAGGNEETGPEEAPAENTPVPRASQFVYGKNSSKPAAVKSTGPQERETSKAETKQEIPLPRASEPNPKTEKPEKKESEVVSFSSMFGNKPKPATPAAAEAPAIEPKASTAVEAGLVPTEVEDTKEPAPAPKAEEAPETEPIADKKPEKKRRLDHLQDSGIDVNSNPFLKKIFEVTKDK
ncbi:TraM recognition domain-containing protein [Cohnella sp. AR92]|uniref:TraM recognition domain-containing protein n=1 Tax=Cohnella sp. AR92 TaxID=648716 RepID=UPI0013157116|nr:TraM recognition domain-containing protein [Cohnella sp. AR92]